MPRLSAARKILITGLGTGYLPVAPGTWGSAAAAAVFVLIAWGSGGNAACTSGVMVALAVVATGGCVALGRFAEETFGRKDPSQCSLDEWAGQALTYAFLPLGAGWSDLLIVAGAGFVAFRLFDIVKPSPAQRAQHLPAGWGIVLDDLIAAAYANVACQLLLRLWLLR